MTLSSRRILLTALLSLAVLPSTPLLAQVPDSAGSPWRAAAPGADGRVIGPSQAQLDRAADNVDDWLYATHDYSGRRFVALDQVDRGNVGELRPVCMFQAVDDRAFHTNPLVYDGVMYLTTRYETIAMDARTCRVVWRRSWDPERETYTQANRGVALKDGVVVRGTADGRLIAMDAATGATIWERKHAEGAAGEKFNMAPLIFEDLVVIGIAGSEAGINGWIGGFRLSDGEPVWRFHVIPEPGTEGAGTWGPEGPTGPGGGGVWTQVTLDPASGELYVGTADPIPAFDGATRPGDNLYTNSLVVLDVRTGERLWHRQIVPHDLYDRGVTSPGPLYTTVVDGVRRDLVAVAGKEGVLRALDRRTREEIFATPVSRQKNTTVAPTEDGIEVCPGILGGVQWNGPAYHPGTNLLYVPSVDWCMTYRKGGAPDTWLGRHFAGALDFGDPAAARGWLNAVDASTGEIRWRYPSDAPMVAAAVATSGGLVFTGEVSGDFLALDADTGEVLYRFHTGGALNGGIVTYRVDGKQYVAATSGGMTRFWSRPPGSATVVVFALP